MKSNNKSSNQKSELINKKSKRLGAAKKELSGFNMSLEEINSIPVEGFDL